MYVKLIGRSCISSLSFPCAFYATVSTNLLDTWNVQVQCVTAYLIQLQCLSNVVDHCCNVLHRGRGGVPNHSKGKHIRRVEEITLYYCILFAVDLCVCVQTYLCVHVGLSGVYSKCKKCAYMFCLERSPKHQCYISGINGTHKVSTLSILSIAPCIMNNLTKWDSRWLGIQPSSHLTADREGGIIILYLSKSQHAQYMCTCTMSLSLSYNW